MAAVAMDPWSRPVNTVGFSFPGRMLIRAMETRRRTKNLSGRSRKESILMKRNPKSVPRSERLKMMSGVKKSPFAPSERENQINTETDTPESAKKMSAFLK
jgi:hypothetical protein